MRTVRRVCSIVVVAAILAAPSAVMAQPDSPAAKYDACMDRAEASFLLCLDAAGDSEYLCWSTYGYAKLWCTVSYGVRTIIRRSSPVRIA